MDPLAVQQLDNQLCMPMYKLKKYIFLNLNLIFVTSLTQVQIHVEWVGVGGRDVTPRIPNYVHSHLQKIIFYSRSTNDFLFIVG